MVQRGLHFSSEAGAPSLGPHLGESQNHRIAELERTHMDYQVQIFAVHRTSARVTPCA